MPVQTTYPGVYVQEVPSAVRTITGVSTSVTAFIRTAKRGPINKASIIFSYSDFERTFGGLSSDAEMGFAVKQFFLNGGSQAIIVRVARDPLAASRQLFIFDTHPSLLVTALDEGSEGNRISLSINYQASNPDSLFNLVVNYSSDDDGSNQSSETFLNLSMDKTHSRFAENIVNGLSKLVKVSIDVATADLPATKGIFISGPITYTPTLLDATHNAFRVAVNGMDPLTVVLNPGAITSLDGIKSAIATSVQTQSNGNAPQQGFSCAILDGDKIEMDSGTTGADSRVEILPGLVNDCSVRLKLSLFAGARQIDAAASIRPMEVPLHATVTSGNLPAVTGIYPGTNKNKFRLTIDGGIPKLVTLPTVPVTGATEDDAKNNLASLIQQAVRSLGNSSSYAGFTAMAVQDGANTVLKLSSGTTGSISYITIAAEAGDSFADDLNLLIDGSADTASVNTPADIYLRDGIEFPVTDDTAVGIYTGSRSERSGIYALESADIFNILCLPGISDGGILSECDAYCQERRAFMIVDPPMNAQKPADMADIISGNNLPKSDHAAVFYPWVRIANPLNGGQLKTFAPSGSIAGLFARIDGSRGVWKAPAGTEANLLGVRSLDYTLTDRENGFLNPLGANCLRVFPDAGVVSWGSRTLLGSDSMASEWKYIPVRRTALFIEESLYRGLKWVVFEPNDEQLWSQIRLNVGAFMYNLFRQGAFQGQKKTYAYFVKCDSETTTQNDIDLGRVNIMVGFAPLKPAEFVILYLQQMSGQIQV